MPRLQAKIREYVLGSPRVLGFIQNFGFFMDDHPISKVSDRVCKLEERTDKLVKHVSRKYAEDNWFIDEKLSGVGRDSFCK